VWLGLITDEELVPDPETIVAEFQTEFDELLRVTQEGKGPPDLQGVTNRLGETLDALDAVLEDEDTPSGTPTRCQAQTKAGRLCKNRPLAGSRYCRVHQ
jgi:hypothetical protein